MTAYVANSHYTQQLILNVGDSLFVTETGSVSTSGTSAISGLGANWILVAGTVRAEGLHVAGIAAAGNGSYLLNQGDIAGGWYGVQITTSGGAGSTIVNEGTIRTLADVTNYSAAALSMSTGNDVVINNGVLWGPGQLGTAVYLGAGDDIFDGRLGTQNGINGGDGNDQLFGGAGVDVLFGGSGINLLSGGGGADILEGGIARYDVSPTGLTASLFNPANNTGEAAGDQYVLITGLIGSHFNDVLISSNAGDTISGMGGNDAIAGNAGADILNGNEGADIIFGGADGDLIAGGVGGDVLKGEGGADLFVFNAGDNGDLILDLNAGGVRDGFDLRGYFDAAGYTGTDPRGAGILQLFQNGADTDVYLHGGFAFRIQGVVAAAIDDSYFLFQ